MKILHVEAGKFYYGGARQVAYIIEGLAARGVQNVLACPIDADIASAVGNAAKVCELRMGGDADVGMAWRLAQLIRAEQPDIVHLHSRRGADTWGGLAARWTGTPCVLSRRVDNPEARWQVALKYRLYDYVITISEGIRRVLLDEGLAPQKVTCVRSAVDAQPYLHAVDRAAFMHEFGLPPQAIVVGMVAQLIPRKGHRYLIEAVAVLREHYPDLRVLFFGRGPLQSELENEIAQAGLADVIRLAGFRNDLPQWLGGLDILAHPADMEGLGVSLLQASAAGVPIITSRAGGLPEAVADNVSGLLIPPGDVAALTQSLRRLLDDAGLRRQMGEAGRARILAEFSIDAMVEGNLAVYRQVLAKRGR
ncbi:glycosyltransferase [Oxalicibacterium solurbis]|uniref:Glycosyl transferase n=1 Tax=Oxalicibacterium solurbis TaxID=69280 RepID=A0A8J3AXW8_9BURK|nr:glycosyltransferase [Oxalicibacterium solurbis]GGI55205.1 glycosyl transferase [Oxalicibacterium solurbis]